MAVPTVMNLENVILLYIVIFCAVTGLSQFVIPCQSSLCVKWNEFKLYQITTTNKLEEKQISEQVRLHSAAKETEKKIWQSDDNHDDNHLNENQL